MWITMFFNAEVILINKLIIRQNFRYRNNINSYNGERNGNFHL